jgi:hypothetical protein
MEFLFGHALFRQEYWLARFLIQRGVGLIYLLAFIGVLQQFKPLLGEKGLLPVPNFLKVTDFNQTPSIFHFYYSDKFLTIVAWCGIILALSVILGLFEKLPWWGTGGIFALLWILYLSIVNVGQVFYSFGWESLLLEVGFLAIFLGSGKMSVPLLIIWLLRFTLFRLEFGAGLIKFRGDMCWRDLTCLYYHHETQPMPNPLSWFFHNLPKPIHKLEVLGNHFFQLIAPWGLFFPQPIAAISGALIMFSQFWLILSGNYAWLNWMAVILALSAFPNAVLGKIFPIAIPQNFTTPLLFQGMIISITLTLAFLAIWPIKNMFSPRQLMNASFNSLHIMNTYGAFGAVTKQRYEIVIEGTSEEVLTPQTKWKEYEFKGKPGNIFRLPRQYAPYHLRLDWLMWFQAFNPPGYYELWFVEFIQKLLEGDKAVLSLLAKNPFPDAPPRFIRARYYLYEFTTPKERKETGAWWKRTLVSEYLPPITLEMIKQARQ